MARSILRTGKQKRAKTAIKDKRFRCAKCRKTEPETCQVPGSLVLP